MGKDQDRPLFSLAASCLQVADMPDKTLKALYQSLPEVVCLVLKGESGEERFHRISDLKLQGDSVALLKLPATKEGPFLERLLPLFLFSIFPAISWEWRMCRERVCARMHMCMHLFAHVSCWPTSNTLLVVR